jgi:hypothetical protein
VSTEEALAAIFGYESVAHADASLRLMEVEQVLLRNMLTDAADYVLTATGAEREYAIEELRAAFCLLRQYPFQHSHSVETPS